MTDRAVSRPTSPAASAVWIVLIASATVLSSFALACATPFAALATVAGTRMVRRDALAATGLAWASNQAIGFGLLHYPWTADCIGWGLAIGLAALAATGLASLCAGRGRFALATGLAFVLACVAYEGGLFAATTVLPAGPSAFSASIVARIVLINAATAGALLALDWVAAMVFARVRVQTPLVAERGLEA